MQILFREISLDEASSLITESCRAFLPPAVAPDETAKDLFNRFQDLDSFKVFGFVENIPLTYITIFKPYPDRRSTLVIGPMYVGASYRHQGLGKRQVKEIIFWAKANRIHELLTKTWGANSDSRHIFENLGFVEMKRNRDRADGSETISYTLAI